MTVTNILLACVVLGIIGRILTGTRVVATLEEMRDDILCTFDDVNNDIRILAKRHEKGTNVITWTGPDHAHVHELWFQPIGGSPEPYLRKIDVAEMIGDERREAALNELMAVRAKVDQVQLIGKSTINEKGDALDVRIPVETFISVFGALVHEEQLRKDLFRQDEPDATWNEDEERVLAGDMTVVAFEQKHPEAPVHFVLSEVEGEGWNSVMKGTGHIRWNSKRAIAVRKGELGYSKPVPEEFERFTRKDQTTNQELVIDGHKMDSSALIDVLPGNVHWPINVQVDDRLPPNTFAIQSDPRKVDYCHLQVANPDGGSDPLDDDLRERVEARELSIIDAITQHAKRREFLGGDPYTE